MTVFPGTKKRRWLLLGDALRLAVRLRDGLLGLTFRFGEQRRSFHLRLPAGAGLEVHGFALGLGEQAMDDGHGCAARPLGLAQQGFVAAHEVVEGVGNVLRTCLGLWRRSGRGRRLGCRRRSRLGLLRRCGLRRRGLRGLGLRSRRRLLATP